MRTVTHTHRTESNKGKEIEKEESEEDDEENDEKIYKDGIDSDSRSDSEEDDKNDAIATSRRAKIMRLPFSFKDVEDSLQTHSGDGKQNVRKGMKEFEETCEVCRWTEAQKIIHAKKLLHGSAKLFVSSFLKKTCPRYAHLSKFIIVTFPLIESHCAYYVSGCHRIF